MSCWPGAAKVTRSMRTISCLEDASDPRVSFTREQCPRLAHEMYTTGCIGPATQAYPLAKGIGGALDLAKPDKTGSAGQAQESRRGARKAGRRRRARYSVHQRLCEAAEWVGSKGWTVLGRTSPLRDPKAMSNSVGAVKAPLAMRGPASYGGAIGDAHARSNWIFDDLVR